jgi:hypothetical protein
MNLATALTIMKDRGYCLWVGAGVSLYAARAGGGKAPLWSELVQDLENQAKMAPHAVNLSFPDRLDLVLHALGRARFQKELRHRTHDPLANGLLEAARTCGKNASDPLPPEVRRIAKLGARANPIVNFNIEVMTSSLLGGSEPHAIKCFVPPVPGAAELLMGHGEYSTSTPRHNRSIYHPHGALTVGGICVMASSEYRAMRGTLALQLAVHAAFRSPLAIVGMSLDDEYLRQQLAEFRDQVDEILWFSTSPSTMSDEIRRWTIVNRVTIVDVGTWVAFWDEVDNVLPPAPEDGLTMSWMKVIHEASGVLNENRHQALPIYMFRELGMTEEQLVVWKQGLQLKGIPIPEVHEEEALLTGAPVDDEAFRPLLLYLAKVMKGALPLTTVPS